ncbi:IclR family transcriptional regulator [Candidatus Gracilibacteria bacterium]|nr:IclR family transcriptional regulator [Candidatus Gracilibacteria bacterium]
MVQSLDRAFDVLEVLARAEEDVSLSQIVERTRLPLGTVHRMLSSLIGRGYAVQDRATRLYGPGPMLLEVAAAAARNRRFGLDRIVRPVLQRLMQSTGETSNLLTLQGDEGVYAEQVVSPHLVRMFTEVGQRVPLYCTGGGKAILAGLSSEQFERYLSSTELRAFTPKTLATPELLRVAVAEARLQGYALDDEERELGVCCVAAPLFDRFQRCVGALSISGPTTRLDRARAVALGPTVRIAAAECSQAIGAVGGEGA